MLVLSHFIVKITDTDQLLKMSFLELLRWVSSRLFMYIEKLIHHIEFIQQRKSTCFPQVLDPAKRGILTKEELVKYMTEEGQRALFLIRVICTKI